MESEEEMKVDLVYVIKGRPGQYIQNLVKTVGPKFGENYMVENPLPPHITLKYAFNVQDVKKLEKLLEDFVSKRKAYELELKGFGNFRRFVAFLKPELSNSARNLRRDLLAVLKKEGFSAHKYDLPFKPHATIAYGNTKETFDKIWDYLKTLKTPYFRLKLDNITILREENDDSPWKIHKEIKIK
jgi:2'-5' RNA ligase